MPPTNNITVLYIDDEEANVFMFEMLFKDSFDLMTATSGSEGLQLLNSQPNIGVVITDMNMPKMTGLEFIEEARKDFSEIPFFILSGYDINADVKEALANGSLAGYMMKPYNYQDIIKAVFGDQNA